MKKLQKVIIIALSFVMLFGAMIPMRTEAAVSRKCVMTLANDLSNVKFSSSNSNIATVKKTSDTKYTIQNVNDGKTVIKAIAGSHTYKTTVKVVVDKNGYPTLTFSADDSFKIKTSDSSVISVTSTKTGNGTVTYKITYKSVGTATLKVSFDGYNYYACKCQIK